MVEPYRPASRTDGAGSRYRAEAVLRTLRVAVTLPERERLHAVR